MFSMMFHNLDNSYLERKQKGQKCNKRGLRA